MNEKEYMILNVSNEKLKRNDITVKVLDLNGMIRITFVNDKWVDLEDAEFKNEMILIIDYILKDEHSDDKLKHTIEEFVSRFYNDNDMKEYIRINGLTKREIIKKISRKLEVLFDMRYMYEKSKMLKLYTKENKTLDEYFIGKNIKDQFKVNKPKQEE
jgi:hypothetical protein